MPVRRMWSKRCWALVAAAIAWVCVLEGYVGAAEFYHDGDVDARWDNTIRYSLAFRLDPRNDALISDPNADDGDRNFRPGLISDRLDVLSEFEVSDGDFGLRVSAAGWYDMIYRQRNANDSPATFNPVSVPHDRFTRAVRTLHGGDVQLGDAFVHGVIDIGEMPVSFRIGRHALLWGESLFFAENGIAAGQAPIDVIKESSEPAAEAKEIVLPVWQASAVLQPTPAMAVDLYYQFEARKDQFIGSGSYFSDTDFLGAGGERYIFAPGVYLKRAADLRGSNSGQYGLGLEFNRDAFNFGFYALRFNAKEPEIYLRPVESASSTTGTYQLVYPTGIDLYGASFSSYLGNSDIAGEVSLRRHMPLVSGPVILPSNWSASYPLYAIGNTLHGQVSSTATLDGGPLWDRADIAAEVASNDVLTVTRNAAALEPSRNKFALALEASFEPQYFEVLPGLDLGALIDIHYGVIGNSSTDDSQNAGAGNIESGITATFHTVWKGQIAFTHYLGAPARQHLADRDFISLSIQRTF